MGYRMIRSLSSVDYNRQLFYCDTNKDLPPVVYQDPNISVGSEALSLEDTMHYVLNTQYQWIAVPWGVDGVGVAATMGDIPYGEDDPKPADYVRSISADGTVQWKQINIGGSVWVNVETAADLPAIGDSTKLYLIDRPGTIVKWDNGTNQYERIIITNIDNFRQQLSTDVRIADEHILYYFTDTEELVRYDKDSASFQPITTGGSSSKDIIVIPQGEPLPTIGDANQVAIVLDTGNLMRWDVLGSTWVLLNGPNVDNVLIYQMRSMIPTVGTKNTLYYAEDTKELMYYSGGQWCIINSEDNVGALIFCKTEDSLPETGELNKVYYVLDQNNFYYYDATEAKYNEIITACYLHNYTFKTDFPAVGKPGGVYYAQAEDTYYLYAAGANGKWNLSSSLHWKFVETLPTQGLKNSTYVLKDLGWYDLVTLPEDPINCEMVLKKARFFVEDDVYLDVDLSLTSQVQTHPGNLDWDPQTPPQTPYDYVLSLQDWFGTPGQCVKFAHDLPQYNYVWEGQSGTDGVYVEFGAAKGSIGASVIQTEYKNFPLRGELATLYIATDQFKSYFWNGVNYVCINGDKEIYVCNSTDTDIPKDTSLIYYFRDIKKLGYYDFTVDAFGYFDSGSYNNLTDKPSINNKVLEGNVSLAELNLYSQDEIKELIAAICSVKVVETLPDPGEANTLYYVGTTIPYEVWLCTDTLTYVRLGTSEIRLDNYQTINDTRLQTVSKNIVGAINELLSNTFSKTDTTDLLNVITSNPWVICSSRSAFPTTGATNKLYVATDEQKCYVWNEFSNQYIMVGGTKDYNDLMNKPLLNGVSLMGNQPLSAYGLMSKTEIQEAIAAARSIKVATILPTVPEPSTLYYIGTSSPYEIYLVDNEGTVHDLGTDSIEVNLVEPYSFITEFPETGDVKKIYIEYNEGLVFYWDGQYYCCACKDCNHKIAVYNKNEDLPTFGVSGIVYVISTSGLYYEWNGNRYIVFSDDLVKKSDAIVITNRAAFPAVGNTSQLYIATDDGCAYYWDTSKNDYRQLANGGSILDKTKVYFNDRSNFPLTGSSDYAYVDKSTGKTYIWSGQAIPHCEPLLQRWNICSTYPEGVGEVNAVLVRRSDIVMTATPDGYCYATVKACRIYKNTYDYVDITSIYNDIPINGRISTEPPSGDLTGYQYVLRTAYSFSADGCWNQLNEIAKNYVWKVDNGSYVEI